MATKKPDVAALRGDIAATQAEIEAVRRAPLPLAEAEENMDRLLAQAAALYTPPVQHFARDPDPQLDALSVLMPDPRFDVPALVSFLAAVLDRSALVNLWKGRLRQVYASDERLACPIPLAERAPRLEALRRRLHELEVTEERLVCEAEARGEQIDRRDDCSPSLLFAAEVLAEEVTA